MSLIKKFSLILICSLFLTGCPTLNNPEKIENIENEIKIPEYNYTGGTTYYVSNSGNDSNNGLTVSTPWKTISKVNDSKLSSGAIILFKAGDTFRGQLLPKSGEATNWVKYGSYGEGDKPKIIGEYVSITSFSWLHQGNNIWKLDYKTDKGIYELYLNSIKGVKKNSLSELKVLGDFYFNYIDGYLFIYSSLNPSSHIIEARPTTHIINMSNTNYILFENLHFTNGKAHGFGGHNTTFLIIRNFYLC